MQFSTTLLNCIFARMNLEDTRTIKTLLSKPQKVVILPHKNPDGDAIGSVLALFHYLTGLGQETHVVSPNDYPRFLKWMPGNEGILNYEKEATRANEIINQATLIFTLDFNHLSRTGQLQSLLEESSATFVMIDHHQSPADYALVTYSDVDMSSTCEMVYEFIKALGDENQISSAMATCLYTGIMTDTGSFKFPATSSNTHRVIAELIDKGAKNNEIHRKIYDANSADRLHLLGCALNNMVIIPEFRTAYITLSQEELDTHNFKKGDTEGFVNYGLMLNDVLFAAIFIENKEEGIVKISFRSQGDFSVNEFARSHFNGGGHINAAGGRSETSLEETTKRFESLLTQYKETLTA